MGFAPGALVTARGREWVVLPGSTEDFFVLRPIGGQDADIAGVLLEEGVEPAVFPPPSPDDLGDHRSASLLREALRIGFRATAGPLRSLASIAVTPRSYQLVPLLLALQQDTVRLLLADDVGIGKTIEAGLIATELLQTGQARGLTVLCSPALAEQWQAELREKFGLDAELVLPSTTRRLERTLIGGESLFDRYPVTVVSTDFIKQSRRRHEFLRTCPDLVIVDEAHTCVTATGMGGAGRTQRHDLLRALAKDRDRHLVLATATPHSGNDEAFRNLLALLDPALAEVDLEQSAGRELLARHMVQRRRGDIRHYLDQDTAFPADRLTLEVPYELDPRYRELFDQVVDYARETVRSGDGQLAQRVNWWSALALLRAVASSPRAAAQTLRTRAASAAAGTAAEADAIGRAVVLDQADDEAIEDADSTPGAAGDQVSEAAARRLRRFLTLAQALEGTHDAKIATTAEAVDKLLGDGYDPIVFCRFIDTAEYVAEQLAARLGRSVTVRAVTGTLPPAERLARIAELTATEGHHVLVATDCLSEGVNLQEDFNAVVHYDLAWNPTRHEQREGRVDRFGQPSQTVRAVTVYGADNPIDGIVLEVLLRKHAAIRKATGVSVPVPDSNDAVVEALMEGLLLRGRDAGQLALDLDVQHSRDELYTQWESAAEKERTSQTKYAQSGIKPAQVAQTVAGLRGVLGTGGQVAEFTEAALRALGSTVTPAEKDGDGFTATLAPLPRPLRDQLPATAADPLRLRPDLPARRGEAVLTRTDPHIEAIADYVLESALDPLIPDRDRPARRCAVVRTDAVATRTTVLLVRYRFHLALPARSGVIEQVAEDLALLAYTGAPDQAQWLGDEQAEALLAARPSGNIAERQAERLITRALDGLAELAPELAARGRARADLLAEAHALVRRSARDGNKRSVKNLTVTPEEHADVLGVFVFVPPVKE